MVMLAPRTGWPLVSFTVPEIAVWARSQPVIKVNVMNKAVFGVIFLFEPQN
jgi:hypothetical protein